MFILFIPVVSVSANIFRIVSNLMIAHFWGSKTALVFFHYVSGFAFAFFFFSLLFISRFVNFKIRKNVVQSFGLTEEGKKETDRQIIKGAEKPELYEFKSQGNKEVKKIGRKEMLTQQSELLTINEVANRTKLSIKEINNKIEEGKIFVVKKDEQLFFREEDVNKYLFQKWWNKNRFRVISGAVISIIIIGFIVLFLIKELMGMKIEDLTKKSEKSIQANDIV